MKKILLTFLICLVAGSLVGCDGKEPVETPNDNTGVEQPNNPTVEPNIKEPAKMVNISNNVGVNEVVINGVKIKNVVVVNEPNKKQLEFTLESDQPLTNMVLEVSLLNESVINRTMNLKVKEGEYSKLVVMDFTNDYNNPYQIYFNIK